MNLRSEMLKDAKLIMRDGLLRVRPGIEVDEAGYVSTWRDNLLPDIDAGLIEPDLRRGRGDELAGKFLAVHSSSALTVNTFGPFRDGRVSFPMPQAGDLRLEQFERKFATGLSDATPPHLDASLHGRSGVVAVESKCLEYFTPKEAKFPVRYQQLDDVRDTAWFVEMERLRSAPRDYSALDAAQLIKHGFGLMNTAGDGATLLYIFWEPDDAAHHSFFSLHRDEIEKFRLNTRDKRLAFSAMSYPELWTMWEASGSRSLRKHAERLRLRYGGKLGGYEGYTRGADGRKTDGGFHQLD